MSTVRAREAGAVRDGWSPGPSVSIVVVTYEHADEITPCLEAALAQHLDGVPVEVVVVDSASTDRTLARVREVDPSGARVRIVALDENRGWSHAVNAGAAASTGEVVLLLNPDCVMDRGCVETLRRHLVETPGVGMAAAMLRYPDGRPQYFARRDVTLATAVWAFTFLGGLADRRWRRARGDAHRRYRAEFDGGGDPVEVFCAAGACVAVWRHLLEPRGVDPALPLLFADGDLCRRLGSRGYRCHVLRGATATHAYSTSLHRVPRNRMRAEVVASLRTYAARYWGPFSRATLALVLLVDAAGTLGVALAGRRRTRARARSHVRGTLGGFGLPGGAAPWLTRLPPTRRRARLAVRRLRHAPVGVLRSTGRRLRRRRFLLRLRVVAWLARAHLDTTVHPSVDVAREVVLEVHPRSRVRVCLERDVRVQPGAILRLGGELHVGAASDLRYGCDLNVKGRLELAGANIVGRGATVHADGAMVWEWAAVVGEHVSVLDTDHVLDGSPVHLSDQPVRHRAVRLGAACFVGANGVVTAGSTVGAGAMVGANSVVSGTVAPGVLAMGAPAHTIRQLPAATWERPPRPDTRGGRVADDLGTVDAHL